MRLCLADLLPAFSAASPPQPLGEEFTGAWMPPLLTDLRALDLHVSTQYALSFMVAPEVPLSKVVVAVDGTGLIQDGVRPAWSFCAIAISLCAPVIGLCVPTCRADTMANLGLSNREKQPTLSVPYALAQRC